MKIFSLIWILIISLSTVFAGEGEWSKRLSLSSVIIDYEYGINQPSWIGEDTKSFSSYQGVVYLDYTRKNHSDLSQTNNWRINVTVDYVEGGVIQSEVLSLSYENQHAQYLDYFIINQLSNTSGYNLRVTNISGEYFDGNNSWVSVPNPQYDSHFPLDIDFRFELRSVNWYDLDISVASSELVDMRFDPLSFQTKWSFIEGAEKYDFEWVWIDLYSAEHQELLSIGNSSYAYEKPFELKEPSGIRTWKTNHIIDNTYGEGTLYFRVRAVSKFTQGNNLGVIDQVKTGEWTYFKTPTNYDPLTGSFSSNHVVKHVVNSVSSFENKKNWLYGVAYAENGKSVSSISFYDGSNRGRQSLTYNASDEVTLIGETKFDNEGRQTISVIPAPIRGRKMGYRSGFNLAIDGSIFDENDYDFQNYIGVTPTPLANLNPVNTQEELGAAQYFSSENKFDNDLFRAAIPNANGYVYSQTVYRNDGSGRVERVGGIGEEFQVGSDHAIRTYYGSPTVSELKRLFGDNVPDELNGYRKEMVRDANGQYSVTYYDKRGNVIATGLSGESPTNLIALESPNAVLISSSLNDNNAQTDPYTQVSEHTFLNGIENNVLTLNYDLDGVINTLNSQTINSNGQSLTVGQICSTCRYELIIEVMDQDGNQLVSNGNSLAPYTQDIAPSLPCSSGGIGVSVSNLNLAYTLTEVGEYRIIKTLRVDIEGMQADFDLELENSQLDDSQSFIDVYASNLDVSGCYDNCDSYCISIKKMEYEELNGIDTWQIYWDGLSEIDQSNLIASCILSECNPDEQYEDFADSDQPMFGYDACDSYHDQMIEQISPGGHFYDNTSNSFWSAVLSSLFSNNQANTIAINNVNYTYADFQNSAIFIPEMADLMLPMHREYCHLLKCDSWNESIAYSNGLTSVITNSSTAWPNTTPNSGVFYEPYSQIISAGTPYTEDPFVQDLWNVPTLLQSAVDNYLTNNPFVCPENSISSNTGNLYDYVEAYVNCIEEYNIANSLTPTTTYDEMKKLAYKGTYDQIKTDIFTAYNTNNSCVYFDDQEAIFVGAEGEGEMTQTVNGLVSDLFSNSSPSQVAFSNVNNWIYLFPPECLVELENNGDYNPNYSETDLVNQINPTNIEQLFYDYTIATYPENTWGWFYDPDPDDTGSDPTVDGENEYDAIISLLSSATDCGVAALDYIQTTTPISYTVGGTNQFFSDCFISFIDMINDGLDGLNNNYTISTTSCVFPNTLECHQYMVDVNAVSYPILGSNPCNLTGGYTFELAINSDGTFYNFFGVDSELGGCNFKLYVDYVLVDPNDPNNQNYVDPNQYSHVVSISNPVKLNSYVTNSDDSYQNVILFDVLYSNGNTGTAYVISAQAPCLKIGSFEENTINGFEGLSYTLPNYVENCIDATYGQSSIDAFMIYSNMMNVLQNQFNESVSTCIGSIDEDFSMSYLLKEYQYTLYYYDLAGNLIQTVPPQGVDILPASYDANGIWNGGNPVHKMETRYKYNGLNTLIAQFTPDGGHSEFILDKLYRVRYSQNARQLEENKASYTKYDKLGRVVEAGEMLLPSQYANNDPIGESYEYLKANVEDNDFPISQRLDYTLTFYEEGYLVDPTIANSFEGNEQKNLRNTIGAILHRQADYNSSGSIISGSEVQTVISYSYDAHKNVTQAVTTNYLLENLNQQNKVVEYDYDLISGNVNELIYQKGKEDEFRHKYHYDDNNRIVRAFTSNDSGITWDMDAKYFYYLHGPLARVEIGEDKVQGMDYAYNLQGWLKGVNSSTLVSSRDLGKDGSSGNNGFFGIDAFGYNLGYYNGDYSPIDNNTALDLSFANTTDLASINGAGTMGSLYNGNITHMITALRDDYESALDILGNNYKYDQLQRIKAMDVYEDQNLVASNEFTSTTTSFNNGGYQTRYSFDKNGNLLTLSRRGADGSLMDDFTYSYYTSSTSSSTSTLPTESNRLANVSDDVSVPVSYADDIAPGQASNNYQYDASGQLTKDLQEDIEKIEWTVTGKVKKITFTAASGKDNLKFIYDPMDMRVAKIVYHNSDHTDITTTYYSYDAQGNVLATYKRDQKIADNQPNSNFVEYTDEYEISEFMIYGSSRLGTKNRNDIITTAIISQSIDYRPNLEIETGLTWQNIQEVSYDKSNRNVGNKRYELSNHLGNVLEVITDRKVSFDDNGTTVYSADVVSYSDYYPFGMLMDGRTNPLNTVDEGEYRYGFQGQEMDDEVKGKGNSINYKYRMHDPRIGRFFAVDPLTSKYSFYSPYQFSGNEVISKIELEGLEPISPKSLSTATSFYGNVYWNYYTLTATSGGDGWAAIWLDHSTGMNWNFMYAWSDADDPGEKFYPYLSEKRWVSHDGELYDITDLKKSELKDLSPDDLVGRMTWTEYWGEIQMVQDALNRISNRAAMAVAIGQTVSGIHKLANTKFTNSASKSIKEAWKMGNKNRGNTLERILASTKYKGYEWVGKLRNGYFPTIDYFKKGLGVQLKTFNGVKPGFTMYKKAIDKLKKSIGTTIDGRKIEAVQLDIGVKSKEQLKLFDKITEYAKEQGVDVNFFVVE